jgi:hypothetical protein
MNQSDAIAAAAAFRSAYPAQPKGYFYTRSQLLGILGSNDGMMIYDGIASSVHVQLPVAVDANNNEVVPSILNVALPCPTHCSNTSVMNS